MVHKIKKIKKKYKKIFYFGVGVGGGGVEHGEPSVYCLIGGTLYTEFDIGENSGRAQSLPQSKRRPSCTLWRSRSACLWNPRGALWLSAADSFCPQTVDSADLRTQALT